jgi:hypothetical protein
MNNEIPEAPLIIALRIKMLYKIEADWELWRLKGHGEQFKGIEFLPSKRSFYIDLQLDIRSTLSKHYGLVKASKLMPSEDTLIRFFEPKKAHSFRMDVLNALSIYLDYQNFADFKVTVINQIALQNAKGESY